MLNFTIRQLLIWGAAGLTIIIAYRLYRRYRRKYLRDWFLFVVVFNLGLYFVDLIKTVFPGLIRLPGAPYQQLEMVFNALLIRPFVFLGLLLFLRFIMGLLETEPHWLWRIASVVFLMGHVFALAVLAVRYISTGRQDLYVIMRVLSDWLVIIGLYGSSAFLFFKTRTGGPEPRRSLLRNLGIFFFLCQTVFVFYPSQTPPLLAGFFLILPPLLYLWRIAGVLLRDGRWSNAPEDDLAAYLQEFGLTPREQEIVALIRRGKDNRQMSDELFVSIHTVKHHVTAIFRKLKVRNRIQLVNLVSHLRGGPPENRNTPR